MIYFTLDELTASTVAKINNIDNTPNDTQVQHLEDLVDVILDPLRNDWSSAVIVNSGFRCEKLNKLVGGSATSAHKLGYAADIKPRLGTVYAFYRFCLDWLVDNNVAFDECFLESSGTSRWVHIALKSKDGKQRRKIGEIKK